jgi:ATP-dependent Clp protease adaptor protein ClpS
MPDSEIFEKVETNQKICPRWHTFLLNDDYHSMDFVILLIINVFKKSLPEALKFTVTIHNEGQAILATTSKERAELYLEQVAGMREGELGPVGCTIEPAE